MAIYHCSIKVIKRSQGKSAVAAAAYRSGEKLTNEWDGVTHDYTRKRGVVHSEILLPPHAPPTLFNRSGIWNSVEQAEKNVNAQLAREIEIALPYELDRQAQLVLVRAYVNDTFVSAGMCADFALHDKGDGNPHAHIMLTLRPLNKDGAWGAKCRKEYDLDKNGQRIRLPSGAYKSHRVNATDWNDKEKAEQWRSAWSGYANRSLELHGAVKRIDHRSYKRQAIDKIPSVHMGVAATQMERRGIPTDKGGFNREVVAQNKLLKEIKARIARLYTWSRENGGHPENTSILQPAKSQAASVHSKVKAVKESTVLLQFLQSKGIFSMAELQTEIISMQNNYCALRGEITSTEREIATLNKYLEIWGLYEENKHPKTDSGKLLLLSIAKYLKELKSTVSITPRKWTADKSRLTEHKNTLYKKMKSMHEDMKIMEQIRENAEMFANTGIPSQKEQIIQRAKTKQGGHSMKSTNCINDTKAHVPEEKDKSIRRKLAEAAAQVKQPVMRGHDLMGLERFMEETRHMVTLEVLNDNSPVGSKGEHCRYFLSEDGYKNIKISEQRGEIKIKSYAAVMAGKLCSGKKQNRQEYER